MKEILLTRGYIALVDDEDFVRFGGRKWTALVYKNGTVRAFRTAWNQGKPKTVYLHREILGANPGDKVDHRNLNTLDNQKENLRFYSGNQNHANCFPRRKNKTGFKGVFGPYTKCRARPFYAKIQFAGESIGLGFYSTPEEAAKAYDRAAGAYFGEFARLNFPLTKGQ